MYVFGGKDAENIKLNDLWCFHVEQSRWELIEVEDAETIPMARSGHSATIYLDYMVLFGGIFEITKELNDMPLFDFSNRRWVYLYEENKDSSPVKTGGNFNNNGTSPARRGTLRKMGIA